MRKLQFVLSLASALGLVAGIAQAQELLTNGNLDDTYPQTIVGTFQLPKPNNWVNEGTRVITGAYEDELSSEPWAGPAPTPVTFGGSGLPGPDGCGDGNLDCGVFFKGFTGTVTNGPATGHLMQDNPATPGQRYRMSGWAGAEANFLAAGAELALEFLNAGDAVIGGSVINLLPTLYVDNGEPFDYKQYTTTATAPLGTVEVRVRASMIGGTPNPAGGGQAFVVDDFSLIAVPEPASMLMLFFGAVGLLGWSRRR